MWFHKGTVGPLTEACGLLVVIIILLILAEEQGFVHDKIYCDILIFFLFGNIFEPTAVL